MDHHSIVAKRYKIGRKLGEGTFGDVYSGLDLKSGKKVAVKLSKLDKEHNIEKEATIYKYIKSNLIDDIGNSDCSLRDYGIPNMLWSGREYGYYFLILDRLGDSYSDQLDDSHHSSLSISKVLNLAIDGLQILKNLHDIGLVHRDMKPNNFLTGVGSDDKDKVYVIDFGLAKQYVDSDGRHIPLTFGHKLVGTARYVSRNTHNGLQQSRRDDLESFGYVLVYLATGHLPWVGLKDKEKEMDKERRYTKIGQIKMSTSPSTLCGNLPKCFSQYIEYCQQLEFTETPDYSYLINLFIHEKTNRASRRGSMAL